MDEKEKIIRQKIEEEEFVEQIQLEGVKQKVWEILIKEKQFKKEDIQINPKCRLVLSDCETTVDIDFIINLYSANFMVIKCAYAAIESWERYIIAFARAVKDYQIPYAMVTDGEHTKIIDVMTGSLLGDSIESIFNRQDALKIMEGFKKVPYPAGKIERERRIIYAFEGIKCPVVNKKAN
jgi:Type I restriction enzyme R protein N terminus (HSDR_N)